MIKKSSYVIYSLLILTINIFSEKSQPNIVMILADDMGFGELQILNPTRGKIKTPQLDQIAKDGMIFTDGHSGSSVCTPTRYGLMTGRYAWRSRLQKGVLTGGESLIAEDELTIAKMLKNNGYYTALIGKWHLGTYFDGEHVKTKSVKIGAKVTHGPIDRGGFDEFHGFHHARQMECWIDNDEVTKNLKPDEMLPMLTETAEKFIASRKDNSKPFFLYVPWNSPHSPVTPSAEWIGKSGLNIHADFVMQTDDSFGRVVQALKDNGLYDNTLIICSADNGTSAPTSKMPELIKKGHFPSGDLRGSKADIWDGGHRVPFLALWPNVIKPNSKCHELVCLTDVIATAADITGISIPETEAEDSVSFFPLLKGESHHDRNSVIHHSISGEFSIRKGKWKLITCPNSGGWTSPKTNQFKKSDLENGDTPYQLYDMSVDLSESNNLYLQKTEIAQELRELLDAHIANGRSTPGKNLSNDVEVTVEKWRNGMTSTTTNKKKSKK